MPALVDLVRRRPADCQLVAEALPRLAESDISPAERLGLLAGIGGARARAHVAQCLRCQAELARYRRLLRTLETMRADRIDPTPDTLAAILASLEEVETAAAGRLVRRGAYLGGITVATAAGLLVWMSRRRVSLAS
jgi:hypothetical protein